MDLPLVCISIWKKFEVVWQSSNVVNDIFPPQLTSHHIAEFDILGSPIGSSKHDTNFLEGNSKWLLN